MKLEKRIGKAALKVGITVGILSRVAYLILGFPAEALLCLLLFSFLIACMILIVCPVVNITREDKDYYMLILISFLPLIPCRFDFLHRHVYQVHSINHPSHAINKPRYTRTPGY